MPEYYPIMLDVRGRRAIVIGGDHIAAGKAAALSAAGAQVTVINPVFCTDLQEMEQRERAALLRKSYEPGDLAGAFVVVAATNDRQQIEAIWQETQQRGQLVNIVDVPARCNFILPSILRRDQLTIAVSTEGASPGLARRIRQQLEHLFSPAYGKYLRLAAIVRAHLRKRGVSYERRDEFFGEYHASDVLHRLEQSDETAAITATAEMLRRYDVSVPLTTLETELREAVHTNGHR
ncbi:MAG: bifunctional precorrin-2 dehydrogenase/sirohydrochlorin ferrochelatase [Ktedonobacteraceae bacterium]|nr:bifunctional precorrin-2 dehydrogenase/sirohydrochlorin ferrochelatase [Ktedonobacteraceae bacterium]